MLKVGAWLAIRHAAAPTPLSSVSKCGKFIAVIPLFFFLFGICIGSFLNVCISRIPEGISIVSPGSRCPRCLKPIKPYDNIPVFGWLMLRGKCRNCGLPISAMYPIIEFLTGTFFVLTYLTFDIAPATLKWLIFGCLLIVLIVTDLRVRILPDAINWPGLGIGIAFATRVPPSGGVAASLFERLGLLQPPSAAIGVVDALLGAAFGSFLLWAAAFAYRVVRKREGMGMGDVKMMAMVGAFLGVRGAFLTILIGTLLGSVLGVSLIVFLYAIGWKRKVAKRAVRRGLGHLNGLHWAIASKYQLPLGTFLGIAAFLVLFALPRIEYLFRW